MGWWPCAPCVPPSCPIGHTIGSFTDNTTCGYTPFVNFNNKTALLTLDSTQALARWYNLDDTSAVCTSFSKSIGWQIDNNLAAYGTNNSGGGTSACGCSPQASVVDPGVSSTLSQSGSVWTFVQPIRFVYYNSTFFQYWWGSENHEWTLTKSGDASNLAWSDSWSYAGINSSTSTPLPGCSAYTQLLSGTPTLVVGPSYGSGATVSISVSGVVNNSPVACDSCASQVTGTYSFGSGSASTYDSGTVFWSGASSGSATCGTFPIFSGSFSFRWVIFISETNVELYFLESTGNYSKFTASTAGNPSITSWNSTSLTYDSTTGSVSCDLSGATITLNVT